MLWMESQIAMALFSAKILAILRQAWKSWKFGQPSVLGLTDWLLDDFSWVHGIHWFMLMSEMKWALLTFVTLNNVLQCGSSVWSCYWKRKLEHSSPLMSYPYTWKPDGNLNSDYLPLPKTLVACQKIHLLTFRRTCFFWVMYMMIEPNSVACLIFCQV